MSVLIEFDPQLEARLLTEARRQGKTLQSLLTEWIEERAARGDAVASPGMGQKPGTGAELLAYWEREGIHPLFQDASDSVELVQQWRKGET